MTNDEIPDEIAPRREDEVLLLMFLEDMAICRGEAGRDYKFQELSQETVEAADAYAGIQS